MAPSRKKKHPAKMTVTSKSQIPMLENVLKSKNIKIILIFADWCGACTTFRKNIWDQMLPRSAIHSRIAIRDDMVPNTSLSQAAFEYLPSILVVDEAGTLQSFSKPGGITNAMPTPKTLDEMTRIVNVPVTPRLGTNTESENYISLNKDNGAPTFKNSSIFNTTPKNNTNFGNSTVGEAAELPSPPKVSKLPNLQNSSIFNTTPKNNTNFRNSVVGEAAELPSPPKFSKLPNLQNSSIFNTTPKNNTNFRNSTVGEAAELPSPPKVSKVLNSLVAEVEPNYSKSQTFEMNSNGLESIPTHKVTNPIGTVYTPKGGALLKHLKHLLSKTLKKKQSKVGPKRSTRKHSTK